MLKRDHSNGSKRHRSSGLALAAVWLHLIWLIVILFIIFLGPYAQDPLVAARPGWLAKVLEFWPVAEVSRLGANSRALSSLDLIALSFTILGVVLAIFAIGGYVLVRGAAMDAASDEARDTVLKWLKENRSTLVDSEVVTEILETERIMATLANEVEKRISDNEGDQIGDDAADRMADAVDEMEGEGE